MYIVVAVIVLAGVAVLVFRIRGGNENRLTPLAAVAFSFVIAGIAFGDTRALGYSLMGVGVALAVADILIQRRG